MRLQREAFNGRQLSLKPRMEQALAFIIATDVFKPNWECHSHKYNLSYSETGHLQMSVYFLTASKPPFTPLFHSFTFTLTPLTSLLLYSFFCTMKPTLTSTTTTHQSSALAATLGVWLLSNLGGTALLTLDFNYKYPSDLAVPLMIGSLVALMSLACVPLAWPFFAFAQRACTGWKCRLMVLMGVLVVFAIANLSLVYLLPIGPLSSLLVFSQPYLGAAVLAIAWLYRPRQMTTQLSTIQPLPAAILQTLGWRKVAPALAR